MGAQDGLAQARVALTLKSASARRQHDIVSTMQSEVRRNYPRGAALEAVSLYP